MGVKKIRVSYLHVHLPRGRTEQFVIKEKYVFFHNEEIQGYKISEIKLYNESDHEMKSLTLSQQEK